jgi:hypothetical protein
MHENKKFSLLNQVSEFSIQGVKFFITKHGFMDVKDGQTFKAVLVTKGRKTGKEHLTELRAVYYDKKVYFSRRNPNSDWLKNAIANNEVKIEYDNTILSGIASLVTDENLARKISQLKYSDKRSEESRIVLQVTLCE